MSLCQVGAFTGGSAFAAKAPRVASVRMVTKGARKNVIMMSAATDEIVEKLKTLTVRARHRRRRTLRPVGRSLLWCRSACWPLQSEKRGATTLSARSARSPLVLDSFASGEVSVGSESSTLRPQLLEAAELVKQIETTFGVDASAPVGGGMMMAAAAAPAEEAEVQTEFKLTIVDCAADKRIGAIKVVRSMTTLGLKEAKDAVTTLPFVILEGKPKAEVRQDNMQRLLPLVLSPERC